jgi:nucleotide-binding universal stress UspA family protein
MLVTLDGSKLAENVLPYARALAGALQLPVELLSVVDSMDFARTSHAGHVRALDAIIESVTSKSKQYLEKVASSFTGIAVTSVLEQGEADKIIIERAARDKETLIAMATRGRSITECICLPVQQETIRWSPRPKPTK